MTVGWVASALVGAVLLVAGTSKLANRSWQQREVAIGTPGWVLPFIAPVEIVLGALMVVRVQRFVIGIAAVALFLVFTMFLSVKWDERRGEPCNCMGMLSTRPASWRTIVRNALLIAGSLVAAFVR
jgi:uncharacterized membrane protein YphA (DoxX/SURF4 family)